MNIFFAEHFKKQLKRLKRKYPHMKGDLLAVLDNLNLENEIHIGRSIFKVRVGSSDMKKGKAGGFRLYIFLFKKKDLLVPLCIYAKSEMTAISENELQYHFDRIFEEMLLGNLT